METSVGALILSIRLWLIVGLIFSVAEIVVPGGVVIFLGLSAFLVAFFISVGIVETWTGALTLWFISSFALLICLRGLAQKMIAGDETVGETDENFELFGKVVDVIETIGPGEHKGRVTMGDATWGALSDGRVIKAGKKVKIISRENITLVVSAASMRDVPGMKYNQER